MAEIIKSALTGKNYNLAHTVRLLNAKQCAFYIENSVMPVDIYVSKDYITGKPMLVFLFDKSETRELYAQWVANKQDKENNNEKSISR